MYVGYTFNYSNYREVQVG